MPNNVIKMTNEFRTSRLCARCFTPFPLNTLKHRYKVCDFCLPDQNEWPDDLKLPTKIVTKKSKRMLLSQRRQLREAMIENQAIGFVSKMICYHKNWQQPDSNHIIADDMDFTEDVIPDEFINEPNPPNPPILKTIWHRDISAAKLILYRGTVFN